MLKIPLVVLGLFSWMACTSAACATASYGLMHGDMDQGDASRGYTERGDQLMALGYFKPALNTYEAGLRADPLNISLKSRFLKARQCLIEQEVTYAEFLLAQGHPAQALRSILRARRLPINLEDKTLVSHMDALIQQSAVLAQSDLARLQAQGRWLALIELSEQIIDALGRNASTDGIEALRERGLASYTAAIHPPAIRPSQKAHSFKRFP